MMTPALNATVSPVSQGSTIRGIAWMLDLLAGFVFVLVDTDQYMPHLNPFTFDSLFGAYNVMRCYNYGFTLYFFVRMLRFSRAAQSQWWRPAAIGIGVYAVAGALRLFKDGRLFQPFESLDLRNIVVLGLVMAMVANPSSWRGWLRQFSVGAGAALVLRIVTHFLSGQRDTSDFLGVETGNFYEGFNIQCEFALALGVAWIVCFAERRRWLLTALAALFVFACLGVIGSGFRRMPIAGALFVPCAGLCIGFWLLRRFWRGVGVLVPAGAAMAMVTAGVVVGCYGVDASVERIVSLSNPLDANVAQASNHIYLDDLEALGEILKSNPLGVGYGNPFGVHRFIDAVFIYDNPYEGDLALHVGSYEMLARMGVFGILLIGALAWTVLRALARMRGNVTPGNAMIAGVFAAFFLFHLLMPFAPPATMYLKVMATYGIALGGILQMGIRGGSLPSPTRPAKLFHTS